MSFKKRVKLFALSATLLFYAAVLLINPEKYAPVAFEGLCLWAQCVIPCLLPFMIICLLFINTGAAEVISKPFVFVSDKLRLCRYSLWLFALAAVCGYPAGSRLLCEYRKCGLIGKDDLKRLAPLCSVPSPIFLLGTVGGKAFSSRTAGIKLLVSALLCIALPCFICALLQKSDRKSSAPPPVKPSGGNALENSFYGAVVSCLTAGAFICFFYTLAEVIDDFNLFNPLAALIYPVVGECAGGLLRGLTETTGACFLLGKCENFFALPCAGFLCVFGGASIIFQQLCYLAPHGVKSVKFILFKLLQAILCFALLCLFNLF